MFSEKNCKLSPKEFIRYMRNFKKKNHCILKLTAFVKSRTKENCFNLFPNRYKKFPDKEIFDFGSWEIQNKVSKQDR